MKRFLALSVLSLLVACDPKPQPAQPQAGKAPLDQAREKIQAKDYPGAILVLEEARRTGGEDPAIVKGLMELYRAQGESARAIQRGRACLEAHPEANDVRVAVANLYIESAATLPTDAARPQLLDPAKALLLDARQRGAGDALVSLPLGTILARCSDVAGARAEFERALAAGGDERTARYNLALLLVQEREPVLARAQFAQLLEKFPDSAPAKREMARLDLEMAIQQAQAKGTFDQAVVKKALDVLWDLKDQLKNDWRVQEGLGDGWMLMGDFDAALVSYTEALRLGQNPKSVEDRYRMAKQKQAEAAEKAGKAPESGTPDASAPH